VAAVPGGLAGIVLCPGKTPYPSGAADRDQAGYLGYLMALDACFEAAESHLYLRVPVQSETLRVPAASRDLRICSSVFRGKGR